MFNLIIGEDKANKEAATKKSFVYKVKFLLYFINTIISLTLVLLDIFFSYLKRSSKRWATKSFLNSLKIFTN